MCVVVQIPALDCEGVSHHVGFCERCVRHTAYQWKYVQVPSNDFLFRMRVVFISGNYVIQHPSYLNEAQPWSGLIERTYDREHVQAIRVYSGRDQLTLFLHASWKFWRSRATMDATRLVLNQGGHDVVAF